MLVEQGAKRIFICNDLLVKASNVVIVRRRFFDITSKRLQIDIKSLVIDRTPTGCWRTR